MDKKKAICEYLRKNHIVSIYLDHSHNFLIHLDELYLHQQQ